MTMFHPLVNSLTLRAMYVLALARAFLRYRNPRRRQAAKHRDAFYESVWRDAARALDASWKPLGSGIAEISLDGVTTRVTDNTCEIDGPVTLAILSDKALTYRILKREGLAIPAHAIFSLNDLAPALDFRRRIDRGCVVKPANGTGGGRGITTGVRSRLQLARAAAAAAVYCDQLLIEEQVRGDNYRLLYLDGKLLDAFVRRPPTVVGDGRSTVARLVRRENRQRLESGSDASQELLTIDLDMRRTLARQNLSFRSVPAKGQAVILKTVVNQNRGHDNTGAARVLCPSVIEDGARAVRALGVRLAGVDVITTDPGAPLPETGGVILEVNAPPNFYFHYHKRDGPFPVAEHVLRRLLLHHGHHAPELLEQGAL
jgi:cyanophycin synthetase